MDSKRVWVSRLILAALAVAALGLTGLLSVSLRSRLSTPSLAEAVDAIQARSNRRVLLPRLTGVSYAPHRVERGSPQTPAPAAGEDLSQLAALETAARRQKDGFKAMVGRALLGRLTGGSEAAFSVTLQRLEAELARQGESAEALSDLAALTLSYAVTWDRPEKLPEAYELTSRALALNESLPQGRFNHALVLEELGLADTAREAWQSYLELDDSSPWAEEARLRLGHLDERRVAGSWEEVLPQLKALASSGQDPEALSSLLSPFRAQGIRYLERELLREWGESPGSGDVLRAGRRIAEAISALATDPYPVDLIAAVEVPGALAGPAVRQEVADACRLYHEARDSMGRVSAETSRGAFLEAIRKLAETGSPLELRARYDLAILERRQQRYDAALELLRQVLADPRTSSYPVLRGETLWMVSNCQGDLGQLESSLESSLDGLAAFDESGDPDRRAGMLNLVSEKLDLLGREEGAWRYRVRATSFTDRLSNPLRTFQMYLVSAVAAWTQGYPALALAFQDRAVAVAPELGEPAPVADSLAWRSRMHVRRGDPHAAREDLERAWSYQGEVPEGEALRTEANLQVAQAELLIDSDPSAAVDLLTRALQRYSEGFRYPIPMTYATRGLAHLALGDAESAESDLDRCIDAYEQIRGELTDRHQRIAYFEQSMRVFRLLTELQLEQGKGAAAFETSEKQRARTLLDSFLGTAPAAADRRPAAGLYTAEQIQARLPRGVALLEYVKLRERWWVLVSSRDTLDWVPLPLGDAELAGLVREFLRALLDDMGSDVVRGLGQRLYRALIPSEELEGFERWVVVPDGQLHALPLDALVDPGGRFLVETRRISLAPSANLYVRARERHAELGFARPGQVLVVGNPAFDRKRFREADLKKAAAAAFEVAEIYAEQNPLIGDRASKERFLERAYDADVIHFGGHAVVNHQVPERSYLLFAPSETSDGVLYAKEIYARRFDRTRLAVLAACGTASGRALRGEGVFSLSYAFQSAGVPAVVASLWSVEDRGTAELLTRLHRRLKAGDSSLVALRRAKLSLLASQDEELRRPKTWAAFQAFGEAFFDPEGGTDERF